MAKLSIIIPIYNVEKYLDRCMQSVFGQTLKDIEIILVDDDSPDNCPQMCDDYAQKDSRIKVVHKKNEGLGYARNSGLEVASGEYIAFLDSDDRVCLDAYEKLYNKAKGLGADVVYGWNYKETNDGHWIDCCRIYKETVIKDLDVKDFMLDLVAFPPKSPQNRERLIDVSACMAIYKRSIISTNHIQFMSERCIGSEDLVFNVDYLKFAQTIVLTPFVFYYYYHNGASLSATFKPQKYYCFKELRTCLNNKLKDLDPQNYRSNRVFIGYVRAHLTSLIQSTRNDKDILIKEILNDDVWKEVSKTYYPSFLNKRSGIFYFFIIHKWNFMLKIYASFFYAIKQLSYRNK